MSVMKKILLLSLLLAIPFSSFAGKRLTTLTHTSKSSSESGVFTYDEEGRVHTDSYTLNGIRLQGAPTQQCVYIRNGKKMIVK